MKYSSVVSKKYFPAYSVFFAKIHAKFVAIFGFCHLYFRKNTIEIKKIRNNQRLLLFFAEFLFFANSKYCFSNNIEIT